MPNTVTIAEIKRRGMAALDDALRHGPVHITKRNKAAAVVLTTEAYQRLVDQRTATPDGMSALQWLLTEPSAGKRSQADIDAALARERDW